MANKVLQIHEILLALIQRHKIFDTHLKCTNIVYGNILGLRSVLLIIDTNY